MQNTFKLINPEQGFTSDVITDSRRFVGRSQLVQDAMRAVNTTTSLITVYGKRGVGKSSLLRQIQNIATGDYELSDRAGLHHLAPEKPRRYYTVFYTCDSSIKDVEQLLIRICTDTDETDGLLRLVPDKGKELIEFSRSYEADTGADLRLVKWGAKGAEATRYKSNFSADIFQTFRNFCNSILPHNNRFWRKRDGVLILVDEFDVVRDKSGFGSLVKALTSSTLKFAISGIADDLHTLIEDHGSVERLIEQGVAHVKPMPIDEVRQLFRRAEELFEGVVRFEADVVDKIFEISGGYPYFVQLIGKTCVEQANERGTNYIDNAIYSEILNSIREGKAFPNIERKYQLARGESEDRATILTLLAEEKLAIDEDDAGISLRNIRATAQELNIEYMDQLVPRLLDPKFGPVLVKKARGTYEFVDPVLRAYVMLRR